MKPRPLALTADLIARAHQIPVADDPSALHLLDDAALGPGLRAALAGRTGADLWVFGYGSLLWSPEFSVAERRVGTVRGWHRRFCLLQRRFRGTPERPGLVLALERGGACRGVAFRLPAAEPQAALMPVWRREMKGRGYAARWVRVETADGPVTALTFVVERASDRYTGRLDEAATADLIATGCGHLGPSADYLRRTVAACAERGIHDPHLWRLQALVAERLAEVLSRARPSLHGSL